MVTKSSSSHTKPGSPNNLELWDQPNKFAPLPGIEIGETIVIHGYQEFQLSKTAIAPLPADAPLQCKQRLAAGFIQPDFLTGRSMLDIGANAGFFSFSACLAGAVSVVSLDMDNEYLELIRQAQANLGWKQIRPVNSRVQDWNEPADLVLAFAMVHWLYSCTANYGSLDAVIQKLASLTRSVLLVEWVAPVDPAIKFFNHTDWNENVSKEGYTLAAFEAGLQKHFAKVEIVGDVNPTRTLYAGYKQRDEITIHPALPLLVPAERVISSRCLVQIEGVKYYSRVYRDEANDRLIKQASGNLAMHEAQMLSLLSGLFFPRVFSSEQREGYSVLTLERISGVSLAEAAPVICATPRSLASFMKECLQLVKQLQAAHLRHRDIRLNNFIIRDGHPVLIDFGWAELEGQAFLNPPGLGGIESPTEGPLCDVYSLAKVFTRITPKSSESFVPLFDFLCALDVPANVRLEKGEQMLNDLKLPEHWDGPVVFPVGRNHPRPVLIPPPPPPPPRLPWLPRTWQRWQRSVSKRFGKKAGDENKKGAA